MRCLFLLLLFAMPIFAGTDVCQVIKGGSGQPANNVVIIPPGTDTLSKITSFIDSTYDPGAYDVFKNVIFQVLPGTYTDSTGIIIRKHENRGLCLDGGHMAILSRSSFTGAYDQPVIMIDGASNVVIKDFEITGVFAPLTKASNVAPSGIAVLNSSDSGSMDNIKISGNYIHTLGIDYRYNSPDGAWRDHNKDEKTCNGPTPKINLGNAYGIRVHAGKTEITDIKILDNKLSDLHLGTSEAVRVGEWVTGFLVSRNTVSNVDNIGIDIIGMEGYAHQPSGVVENNVVSDLKGGDELPGQNGGYPFVAGIYIDGGTGYTQERPLMVYRNTVTSFGVGIQVGSENSYCNNSGKCKHVQIEHVNIDGNILKANLLYGIGVGKDVAKQDSRESDVKISNNTLMGNDTCTAYKDYSELYFGTLNDQSLSGITVVSNKIEAAFPTTFLVKVGDSYFSPDVTFDRNVFYKQTPDSLWNWNKRDAYYGKNDLFDPVSNTSHLGSVQIKGTGNCWSRELQPCL